MKSVNNLLATITLTAVLLVSASSVRAGILMTDLQSNESQPCSETDDSTKVDSGILVTFTGILVTFNTGILVTFKKNTQLDCGILVTVK